MAAGERAWPQRGRWLVVRVGRGTAIRLVGGDGLFIDGRRAVNGVRRGRVVPWIRVAGRVAGRRNPLPPRGCLGLALAFGQLLHEIVEEVAHPAECTLPLGPTGEPRPTGFAQGRWSPSTARRKAARATSASAFGVIAAARAGSQRIAAWTTSGADQGWSGSSGGAGSRRRTCWRPASSRTKPDSPPERSGPSRASGGSGGGPAAGAAARQATIPSASATQRTASHQPSISVGRSMPARQRRSPSTTSCSRMYEGPGGERRVIAGRIARAAWSNCPGGTEVPTAWRRRPGASRRWPARRPAPARPRAATRRPAPVRCRARRASGHPVRRPGPPPSP